ncbi:MAG: GTP pyrophosphokinase family protein [Lachnospiraceae bacterium]|nr:GTP pyrophosphokinase family protein [Lachnospiraceae bacterium]
MTSEQKEYYGEYAEAIAQVRDSVMAELERILEGVSRDPEQAPFEHLISRIKGAESAKEKLRRKGCAEDAASALVNLNDIIGIRVVTHFIGDIYQILEMISGDGLWKVETVKDYIASPKPNGYRSLHVILSLPLPEGMAGRCGVELQLRTIAMDCWAALEHQMRYKKEVKNTALISAELKRCADEMASADLTMQTIRDVLKGN